MGYRAIYRQSLDHPDEFWSKVASGISWSKKWDKVCDRSNEPFVRWFSGAELNTCLAH